MPTAACVGALFLRREHASASSVSQLKHVISRANRHGLASGGSESSILPHHHCMLCASRLCVAGTPAPGLVPKVQSSTPRPGSDQMGATKICDTTTFQFVAAVGPLTLESCE